MVFGIFGAGAGAYVGLDLGASHIKTVGLKNNHTSRPKLMGMSVVATPQGAINDGAIVDFGALKKTVSAAFDQANLRINNQFVTVGLKGLSVLYKKIVIPFQEPSEMSEQILREAQQQIDSELDDWIIDYQILTETDSQGQVAVMLVAGRRAIIADIRKLLVELGARPLIFDCDVFAVSNIHEQSVHGSAKSKENVLFVDIGKESSKTLLRGSAGIPSLVRSFSLGGQHLTELIAQNMSIDLMKAEVLKVATSQSGSLFQNKGLAQAAKRHIDEIVAEINQTLEFYTSTVPGETPERIDRIVLSGGAATTAGMAQALSQKFGTGVEFMDPFQQIEIPSRVRIPDDIQPHVFTTSVGLALRYIGDKPE